MKKKWILLPAFFLMLFLCMDMSPVRAEVTSYKSYRQLDEESNKYIYGYYFEINNGEKFAFCIQRSKVIPVAESPISDWIELFNEDLRKVLYYGYGGPKDMGYSVVETSCAAAEANGDNNTSLGIQVLEEIRQYESPPPSFRVWKVKTNNGKSQDIAFFTTLTTGKLSLEKESADESVTLDNPEYSLEGAVYGVYEDSQCDKQVGSLTTDENGISETIELVEGTYYIKELIAPMGYQLDESILSIKVQVERTTTITVKDVPMPQVVDFLITKENVIGEKLSSAHFAIYEDRDCKILFAEGNTNEEGEWLVPELKKGTVYYLKEIIAPDGYMKTDGVIEILADDEKLTLINERQIVLPNTGSKMSLVMEVLGICCMVISLKKRRQ